MKLGLLETGAPPEPLLQQYGSYGAMFRQLLGPDFAYASVDVAAGEMPQDVQACDAWLITGSAAGVYDDLPWIEPLKGFLRGAKGRTPLVGVCFGHQIMAEAFGGHAEKASNGWGVGLQTYGLTPSAPGLEDRQAVAAPGSHQDQVTLVPPGARTVGGNAHCPNGIIVYDDPAISIQLHPEFDPAYAAALIEARRGSRYGEAQAKTAIASLAAPNDRARLGGWISDFVHTHVRPQPSSS
jgi:GMP synthase-like glutamine amidotransferase